MRFRSSIAMLATCLGAALLVSSFLSACSSNDNPGTDESDASPVPVSCPVDAPTSCPTPMPTFADVEPIFRARCQLCHSETGGQWPLNGYEHVVDWTVDIRADLLDCTMPPPEARVPITKEERLAILTWIRCETPR